jgi:hypothetical protein
MSLLGLDPATRGTAANAPAAPQFEGWGWGGEGDRLRSVHNTLHQRSQGRTQQGQGHTHQVQGQTPKRVEVTLQKLQAYTLAS